jgi:very-short-patch-repair endonuclease
VGLLDMGWEDYLVAVEYDGDQHRTDRRQFVRDIKRITAMESLGWMVIRIVAEHRPDDIIDRVYQALARRGYRRHRR